MNRKQRRATARQETTPVRKPPNTLSAPAFALAVQLHQSGRLSEAEHIYKTILAEDPDHALCLNLLGVVFAQTGRHDMAIRHIGDAISRSNHNASFHNNLGEAFRLRGLLSEAAQAFRQALVLDPAYAEAHNNLGATRHAMGLLDEATGHYRHAIDLKGNYPEALNNIGAAFQEQNQLDAAAAHYRQAIVLKPAYAEAHSNLGTVLLCRGQFAEGWREYEWRHHMGHGGQTAAPALQPHWGPDDWSGRTVFLQGEQGLGDSLQFSRFATSVAALGAKVVLEAPPALARLLSGIEGVSQVIVKGEQPPPFDLSLSLMSAPFLLGTTLETIPATIPYLGPDRATAAKWADRLASLPGLKVGLVWAGAPRPEDPRSNAIDHRRSMALADMAPLLKIPGMSFVSLQMGPPAAQRRDIADEQRPLDWMGDITDFADTAGLLSHLDLVISVDTSVAHLAGAMGKPVWILSRFDGCWRWLADRDDSPWYPTARLFRQTTAGDWRAVIERVTTELAAHANGKPLPLWERAGEGADRRQAGQKLNDSSAKASPSPRPSPIKGEGEELYARGVALQTSGLLLEAEAAYRAALLSAPGHAPAYNNLANVLTSLGRHDEALAALRSAIVAQPDYAEAHYNLGVHFHKAGRLTKATVAYRNALRLRPAFIEALSNLGAVLQDQDRLAEAERIHRTCIVLQPDYPRAHLNLGVVLKQQDRIVEAIDAYRQALALETNYPLAHVNLAHALLHNGDFEEGWREYEWRWKGGVEGLIPRYPSDRQWNGQKIAGRTILLHAEQGLGDTLQFVRYAASFSRRGASVIVEVQAPLVRLLSGQPGIHAVTTMGSEIPLFDYHLPMMSAPFALKTRLDGIPADIPYIAPSPELATAWGRRLARLEGRKVGIVWAGDPRPHDYRLTAADRRRSITPSRLTSLLSVSGVSFISLQKGSAASQQDDLPPELRPLDLMDDATDFADTAALIANLDLVISVDTSVAHLAGAMGKPVWVLSRFDGCWRWLTERDDSPWYPTVRLFRQTTAGDWTSVMDRVAFRLRKWLDETKR
ncbi:MAG TPA: tetratricopeptide repeat protein [Telmatospirillum sp.]|nr:tetratricopeptide repeat protein [Telmatospirillum sp.]